MPSAPSKSAAILRASVCFLLGYIGIILFAFVLQPLGYMLTSIASVFAAAAVSNSLAMRIFEQRGLTGAGLGWSAASIRNLALGFAGGVAAATAALGVPALAGFAAFEPNPHSAAPWTTVVYVTAVLLFGAFGEEILFRGFAFQTVLPAVGNWATILPFGVAFAAVHSGNPGSSWLSLANTAGWGILLGFAVVRSGDLWLATGLHYGWNIALPFFGVHISGLNIELAGYVLRWKTSELVSGGDYGPEGGLACTGILLLVALFLVKAPIQRQELLVADGRKEAAV